MGTSEHDFWLTFIICNVIAIVTVSICAIIIINMVKRINMNRQDIDEIKEIALANKQRSLANEERSLKNKEIIEELTKKIEK